MNFRLLALVSVGTALSACAGPAGLTPFRLVDVTGPVVVPGAFNGPTFALKTIDESTRVPFELNRLDSIEVWSRKGQASFEKLGELAYSGYSDADHSFNPVKLVNLEPRTEYDVQLRAFQVLPGLGKIEVTAGSMAQGANVADYSDSTTHISTVSQVSNVTNGANDVVNVYSGFKLKLADQDFNGQAAGDIETINGRLTGNGQSMALVTESPISLLSLNFWCNQYPYYASRIDNTVYIYDDGAFPWMTLTMTPGSNVLTVSGAPMGTITSPYAFNCIINGTTYYFSNEF